MFAGVHAHTVEPQQHRLVAALPRVAGQRSTAAGARVGEGGDDELPGGLVPGPGQDLRDGRVLDDSAAGQHRHAPRHRRRRGEVVGDEQDGGALVARARRQQLDDRLAARGVQRRRRLVGDEELGSGRQRQRDRHPLRHAAGELVRVGREEGVGVRP